MISFNYHGLFIQCWSHQEWEMLVTFGIFEMLHYMEWIKSLSENVQRFNISVCVCVHVCTCAHACVLSYVQFFVVLWTVCQAAKMPGFSVHGIFQARMLEWIAVSYDRESSWSRYWTLISCFFHIGRWILYL